MSLDLFSQMMCFVFHQEVATAVSKTAMKRGLDQRGKSSGKKQLIQRNCADQVKRGGE